MPSRLHNALPYLGVVLGIVVLASPFIASIIETCQSNSAVSEVVSAVEQIPASDKAELMQQAQAYNEQLAAHETNDGVWPYECQLSWGASQVMCWIEIPRINVRLPVYHGSGEAELAEGVGHLDFSSLPVGGTSSYCVLSAHSGMPTARMFDDIHDLEPGDVFVIWTLDEPLAYRVTSSETVEPDDVSSLDIEQGKDLCTLVTCTPIGVNSHRLLVHAERCAYDSAAQEQPPVIYQSPRTLPLVVGLAIAGGALALSSLIAIRRKRPKGARPKHAQS